MTLRFVLWLGLLNASPDALSHSSPVEAALVQSLEDGIGTAKLGDWVTYEMDGGPNRSAYWRLAVVEEQRDALDRDACWLELEMGTDGNMVAPLFRMRALVARDAGFNGVGITRLIVAYGADSAHELAAEAVRQLMTQSGHPPSLPARTSPSTQGPVIRKGEPNRILTAMGTIIATPVEVIDRKVVLKRIWVSEEVPVLHLAKLEIPSIGQSMEVHRYGHDAKAQLPIPARDQPQIRAEPLQRAANPVP